MNDLLRTPAPPPLALYVHIPFCETKCPYCDFNTYAGIEPLIPAYVAALSREIELWGRILGKPAVGSVFFGGGTPSYLSADNMATLMETIGRAFDTGDVAEVTLETNPGDLTPHKLASYLESGVDRLSIGVQSLDDRLLGILGRRHSATEAVNAFRMAVDTGFDNVSIDLMYGLPDQSLADWERTLSQAVGLAPEHISMYCLTLEGGTPMEQWVKSGRMTEPDPDVAADMYLLAQDTMGRRGYRHYEISNWALPGMESRHNLAYWRNQPYLGVGPGAHSYLAGHRFHNVKSPREYVRGLGADRDTLEQVVPSLAHGGGERPSHNELGPGTGVETPGVGRDTTSDADWLKSIPVVETVERIDRRLEMAETMMMGLRLDTGIGVEEFARRFGAAPSDVYGDALRELDSTGLLDTAGGQIRLTGRGRLLGNEVFSRFFEHTAATA